MTQPALLSGQSLLNSKKSYSDSLMIQYVSPAKHELDNVEVLSKKFTAYDILDSTIVYAASNYPKPPAYHLKIEVALNTAQDTLFNCTADAYLIRPVEKMQQYVLVVPDENSYSITKNTLDKNQSLRLMQIDGFPKTFVSDYLMDLKKQALKNEAFYVRQNSDGDSSFIIIIKNKEVPGSMFAKRDINPDYPKAYSFRLVTVNRKQWAVTNSYSMVVEATEEQYNKFTIANNYATLSEVLRAVLRNRGLKHFSHFVRFKKAANGYVMEDFLFENNFYLVSRRLLTKTSNSEKSVYYYWMHDFVPQQAIPDNARTEFSIGDMLK